MRRAETTRGINDILKAIGIYGFDGVAIEARDIPSALATLCQSMTRDVLVRYAKELRRQDLVDISRETHWVRLRLTVKAMYRVQRLAIDELTISLPAIWDGRWHMVMFDIPSRHKESRYVLTSQLRRLGFVMLQNSCWVQPYPCNDVIHQLVTYLNLQPFVTIAEITALDASSTTRLRRHFPQLPT